MRPSAVVSMSAISVAGVLKLRSEPSAATSTTVLPEPVTTVPSGSTATPSGESRPCTGRPSVGHVGSSASVTSAGCTKVVGA